ncbi:MAG: hypothetical protein AAF609_22410 [Cyanobacteria bacterium P01_C01_bin.120]
MKIIAKLKAPGLKQWLKQAQKSSGLTVTKFCSECSFTPAHWYRLIADEKRKGASTLSQETLQKIEKVSGCKYRGIKL